MSRSVRALRSSLSSLNITPRQCSRGTRAYAQAVLQARTDAEPEYSPSSHQTGSNRNRRDPVWGSREKFGQAAQPTPLSKLKPEPHFATHLNAIFQPLEFNQEVARRCLTHASHPSSINGHNGGMSFLGRRVLESYLLLYLTSSKVLKPTHDFHFISMWTLHTYTVGHHVGSKWGLGRVMRWVPTVSKEKLDGPLISDAPVGKDELLKSVGLYKVQGDAVAAVMGAIYEQFGASVAHRAFHTRVLPHLLLDGKNGGLPLVFHDEVREICERMGGAESDLTKAPEATTESSQ